MRDDEHYRLLTVKRSRGGVVEREVLPGRKISVKNQFYVKSGDFLISKRQIVHGACGFVPEELDGAIVSNEYSVLRCKPIIDPVFLLYLSFTPYFQQTCFHSSIGVHVEKMIFKLSDWFKWKIRLPSYEEQKKIASFLSSVDSKLTKLREKRELLETYKRGMMQKLFSQERRFKSDDGSELIEWEDIRAKDLFRNVSNKQHDGNLPVLSVTQDRGVIPRDEVNIDIKYDKNSLSTYKKIDVGDFVISLRSFQGGIECSMIEGISSPAYTVMKPKKDIFTDFYRHYFKKDGFIMQLSATVIGIRDGKQISYEAFSSLNIPYPSVSEQQKIADCLSAIDQKIDAVAQQIAQMETFKQGLLQKMFV